MTVPAGSNLDPASIAADIQRVDHPTSIPNRVIIPAHARPWDGQDNDGDGLITATANGQGCVGLNYVDTCGDEITARTIVRLDSSSATSIAGSAPGDVTTVRIEITGATPIDIETITFANYPSRFCSTAVTSGAPGDLMARHRWRRRRHHADHPRFPRHRRRLPTGPATVPTIAANRTGASD